jgi:hypothetical protein
LAFSIRPISLSQYSDSLVSIMDPPYDFRMDSAIIHPS